MSDARHPIEDEQIVALYQSGYSQNDIVQKYAVSLLHTRAVLKSAGFNTRGYRALSPAAVRTINALVPINTMYLSIEKICDISFHAIRDYAGREKVREKSVCKPASGLAADKKTAFLSAYRSGLSFCRLLEDFNLKDNEIYPAFRCIGEEDIAEHRLGLRAEIESLHIAGLSAAGIARRLNISRALVYKYMP